MPHIADLNVDLLQPGKHFEDAYQGRDAMAGNLVPGATSSSKSTDAAAAIILAWADLVLSKMVLIGYLSSAKNELE